MYRNNKTDKISGKMPLSLKHKRR